MRSMTDSDTDADADADAIMAQLDGRATRHVVEHAGGRMVWRRFGAGAPLVLLHGGHGSWLHWARNIDALARHAEVWVPDLPGYGDSDAPPQSSLAALVATTEASLATLVARSRPLSVAGFSFGGLVATHLARARPSLHRLALLGPGGHGGPRRAKGALRSWREASEHGDADALADAMRHNLAMHMLSAPEAIDALALRIHAAACLRTRFKSRKISLAGGLADALNGFTGELLLVWGEDDVTATPELLSQGLAAGHVRRRACILPRAGHWVQYEAAEAVNQLLIDWLAGSGETRDAE